MHVGWLSMLGSRPDGSGLDTAELKARIEGRLHLAPRFRQRVVTPPIGEPLWADDPGFMIERHISEAVADDGGPLSGEELREVADEFLSRQLDRARPLWEILVAPRVEGGRAALLGKVHHAMVDGIAAVELGMLLFDTSPSAARPEAESWQPEHLAGGLRLAGSAATDTALEQFRSAGRAARLGLSPGRTLRMADTMRRAAFSLAEDTLRPAPASYLNRPIDGRRTVATGSLSMARLRRIKDRAGVKLNDVVLTIAAGSMRHLARLRDEDPAPLRVMVPVNVRSDADATSGNRITFAFLDLPVEEPEAERRLALVRQQTAELKRSGRVAGSDLLLRSVVGQLPGPLRGPAARLASSPRLFNLTISNVPGPRRPLYAAGRRVESIHPVIPISAEHGLALGVLSYCGSLQVGVHAHPGTLPEAGELPELLKDATSELERSLRPPAASIDRSAGPAPPVRV